MSSNISVAMKSINTGTPMLMYVVLHGTAQIPVAKAQNQAQNELKRACLGHQGTCSLKRQQLKSQCYKKVKAQHRPRKRAQISM